MNSRCLSLAVTLVLLSGPLGHAGPSESAPLFDGEGLSGWTDMAGKPAHGWRVVEGMLHYPGNPASPELSITMSQSASAGQLVNCCVFQIIMGTWVEARARMVTTLWV